MARYQSGYTEFDLHSCQEDLYWMMFFFILSKLIKLAIVLVDFFFVVPGMEPRALCMLHNGSITEIHPQLMVVFYKRHLCLLL